MHDALEAIQCGQAILDFIMLAQYVSHDNKTLRYMEHALYRLKKTKIAFEQHRTIDSKLCWPTFNYPKFHAISHFVQCIQDYGSTVNYNTAHSETAYKYLFKAFYNKTNRKEYDLQIWQHNICYTNIHAMKDGIILEKAREKKELSRSIVDTIAPAEVAWALSPVNLAGRYTWAISNADLDEANELGLTGIKKYWWRTGQVEMELDWLYDWIPALATFVKYLCRRYDNKEVTENMKVRQDIGPKWVSSLFVQLHGSIQY